MPEDQSSKFEFQVQEEERQKSAQMWRNRYAAIFLSPLGIQVFNHFLSVCCHFGEILNDPDEKLTMKRLMEHDIGVWLILQCGEYSEVMKTLCF